jgi:hypothetical protein
VYCIEHNDTTALHYFNTAGQHKYFKQVDMRDLNSMIIRLGMRHREIDCLLNELEEITHSKLGKDVTLDID